MPPRNTDEQRELGGNCAIFNNCNLCGIYLEWKETLKGSWSKTFEWG